MRQYTESSQYYLPQMTPIVFRLMFLLGLAWILEVVARMVGVEGVQDVVLIPGPGFHPSQIFSHFFYLAPPSVRGFVSLFFEGLVLFFFGSELERQWGSANFLRYFLYGILGGALLTAGTALLAGMLFFIHGIGGAVSAMLLAYAILWPDRPVMLFAIIPIRMKYLILILWVIYALSAVFDKEYNQFLIFLGGALAGTSYIYYYARRGRKRGSYGPPGPEFSGMGGGRPGSVGGPGLRARVTEYFRKRRLRRKQAEIERRINVKDEVDRLLEKISREGINALTRKEKAFLDKASKEF